MSLLLPACARACVLARGATRIATHFQFDVPRAPMHTMIARMIATAMMKVPTPMPRTRSLAAMATGDGDTPAKDILSFAMLGLFGPAPPPAVSWEDGLAALPSYQRALWRADIERCAVGRGWPSCVLVRGGCARLRSGGCLRGLWEQNITTICACASVGGWRSA